MKPKTEEKILREYLKILESPDRNERKFRRCAQLALTIAMVFVFYCFSDDFRSVENNLYIALFGFIAGTAFGLAIWFLQAGTQTKLLARYMAKDAIGDRLIEIRSTK